MFSRKTANNELELFTVFDSKSGSYAEPFPALNREVVIRDFANAFKKDDAKNVNRYYINAEDFSIFKLGSFDPKLGAINSHNAEHVINLHDLRAAITQGALSST